MSRIRINTKRKQPWQFTDHTRIRAADSARATIRKLDHTTDELERDLAMFRIRAALRQADLTLAAIRGISLGSRRRTQ